MKMSLFHRWSVCSLPLRLRGDDSLKDKEKLSDEQEPVSMLLFLRM